MEKRISARAIIIENDRIFLMFRNKYGKKFYAFSGGKKEETETLEECVIRELYEEMGILITPEKLVYEFNSPSSKQYFFICKRVGGIFGTGKGEEFDENHKKNYYEPRQMLLSRVRELNIIPIEVRNQLVLDLNEDKLYTRNEVLVINGKK